MAQLRAEEEDSDKIKGERAAAFKDFRTKARADAEKFRLNLSVVDFQAVLGTLVVLSVGILVAAVWQAVEFVAPVGVGGSWCRWWWRGAR